MMAGKIVRDFMSARLVSVAPQPDLYEDIRLVVEGHISGVPVVDEKVRSVGFLSEKDCFRVALVAFDVRQSGDAVTLQATVQP